MRRTPDCPGRPSARTAVRVRADAVRRPSCPSADLNRVRPRAARAGRPGAAPGRRSARPAPGGSRSMAVAWRLASSCSLAATGVSATRARSRVSSAISLTTISCSSSTASSLRARTSRWWASLRRRSMVVRCMGGQLLRMPAAFPPEFRGTARRDRPGWSVRPADRRPDGPGPLRAHRGRGAGCHARTPVHGDAEPHPVAGSRVRDGADDVTARYVEAGARSPGQAGAGQRGQAVRTLPGEAGLEHAADPPRDADPVGPVDDVERRRRSRRAGPA